MKQTVRFFLTLLSVISVLQVSVAHAEGWEIHADSRENYNGVTLANGRIGIVSGASLFSVSDIVLNGVYDKEYQGGVSRIVRAPLFTNLKLKVDGVTVDDSNIRNWEQTLNMKEAYLNTTVMYKDVKISYTLQALRNLPYMGMGIVEITPKKTISIEVINETLFPEELKNAHTEYKLMRDAEVLSPVYVSQAESRTGMHHLATCSAFLFDKERPEIKGTKGEKFQAMTFTQTLKAGQTYRFALVGAACSSRNFYDPKGEAERMAVFVIQHPMDYMIEGHVREWNELWKSDIVIEGCPEDQLDVRLALYNLYSFQRKGSRLSIPPMGLSTSTGYNGHVFWDSEIWMYPPMLVLNHDIAKAHIDYRTDRLDKALQRAEMFGFKGAMYPWESDDSGEEATPTWCLTGTFEHHITADIAIAFWNYYRVTKDKNWLRREGYKVIKSVADFWASRSTKNSDGTYSIKNVVGANEYAPNVNDNAFTNGSAKIALHNATSAALVLGELPDPQWEEVSRNMKFHYMADGTTKEHSEYQGEKIKQADVNLLAYPLGLVKSPDAIKKDLAYYEEKIDKVHGPAMGNSILSILYCKLGDKKKAYQLFKKSYIPNKRSPFGVLSESASSNNPYFATGAGGMLQAVLFGFAGLEITDDGVKQQNPVLPKQWKSLTIKGVGVENEDVYINNK